MKDDVKVEVHRTPHESFPESSKNLGYISVLAQPRSVVVVPISLEFLDDPKMVKWYKERLMSMVGEGDR